MPTAEHALYCFVAPAALYFKAGSWVPRGRLYTMCEGAEGMIIQLVRITRTLLLPTLSDIRQLTSRLQRAFLVSAGNALMNVFMWMVTAGCPCVQARVPEPTPKSSSKLQTPAAHSTSLQLGHVLTGEASAACLVLETYLSAYLGVYIFLSIIIRS